MLAICTDDQEAEISGTAHDLRKIRIAIVGLLSSADTSVSFAAAPRDPSPYSRALSELIIQHTSGPTLVTVTQTAVVVAGSDDSLARFSSWFNFPPEALASHHSHFEPMPGDAYHSAESIPLVVAISYVGA
jgi:hypothetical protein